MKRVLVYGMTDNPGGIEAYVINLAQRLKEDIIFDYVIDFKTIAHSEFIGSMGSKVYHIPAKSKGLLAHWKKLWEILKNHPEYDTVYFNILDAGAAITEFIPWLMGRKIVTHSHNGSTEKVRLHRLCKPFLSFFTKEYVACSKIASEYMFGNANKALVIPNAIDAKKFVYNPQLRQKKREELGVSEKMVVCHIGRLSPQKNPIRMLDIFKAVLEKKNNAVLVSVGTGEMEQDVHSYAEQLGIKDKVMFLGKRTDIPEILQASDIFFLPSLFEGLPIVALEAQAAGLHCVVSSEISKEVDITGEVSFVPLKETDEFWAEKLLSVFENKVREDTSSKIIEGGYDMNNCREKDLELLKMLK